LDTRDRLKTLIQEKCILRGEFVLASGQKSSVYFDCKRATLDPEGLHLIATLLLDQIDRLERDDGRRIDADARPPKAALRQADRNPGPSVIARGVVPALKRSEGSHARGKRR